MRSYQWKHDTSRFNSETVLLYPWTRFHKCEWIGLSSHPCTRQTIQTRSAVFSDCQVNGGRSMSEGLFYSVSYEQEQKPLSAANWILLIWTDHALILLTELPLCSLEKLFRLISDSLEVCVWGWGCNVCYTFLRFLFCTIKAWDGHSWDFSRNITLPWPAVSKKGTKRKTVFLLSSTLCSTLACVLNTGVLWAQVCICWF